MAIALLPLIEGENLSSNFGRYAEYMGLRSTKSLMRKLFGYPCTPCTRFPSAIDHLAEQTRDYWKLGAEEIVNKHTEFRYATMTSSDAAREKLLKRMLGKSVSSNNPLKTLSLDAKREGNLRYCPECLSEWKRNGIPIHWMMDHQLIGAYVCTKHFCVLKSVEFGHADTHGDMPVATLIKASDKPIIRDFDSLNRPAIEEVAKRSARQRCEGGMGRSAGIYRDLLRDAGFSRTDTLMRKNDVVYAWSDFFGKEYCYLTGMSPARISKWLGRLTARSRVRETPRPFMFIAAECFLEHLVSSPGSYLPAARSKLEKGEAVPEGVKCKGALHRDFDFLNFAGMLTRSGGWKLVCTCGISYRMGDFLQPGTGEMMPFSYELRYQNRFRELMDKGASATRAAEELRLGKATGIRWARREKSENDKTLTNREVSRLRTEWRLLVKSISLERRISAAAEARPAVYRTLLKNDRDWLINFNAKHRSWRPQSSYKVHQPTVAEIQKAWQELLLEEPPVRCSAVSLLEKVGFWRELDRGTTASKLLAELTESHSAYLERVLSWLAKLAAEHRLDSCEVALRRAGLRLRSFTHEQRRRIREIDSLVAGHEQ
ncbi:TnsD family Tn7-like transposition protein [Paraburkholderia youngii]|uniref:TnsD family Tn7-like transposition protein n=1 Tax=Paraburkholderia youngii TaxID=2782701 RepID=UPI003D197D4F